MKSRKLSLPRLGVLDWLPILLLLAAGVNSVSGGDVPVPKAARFEVSTSSIAPFAPMVMIDTATGECWVGRIEFKEGTKFELEWKNLDFPVKDTKVEKGQAGRFRLTVVSQGAGEDYLLVTDTLNGRCWFLRAAGTTWRASPAPAVK